LEGTTDAKAKNKPCPAGTYSATVNGTNFESCDRTPCEIGFYCYMGTNAAMKQDMACPVGKTCFEGSDNKNDCFNREPGQIKLCYKIWHDYNETEKDYRKYELVRPVSGFPENHAMVAEGYCGGAKAGDPIPFGSANCTNCKFGSAKTFEGCPVADKCINEPYYGCAGTGYVNGGSMFYAYNSPVALSSNTGYQEDHTSDVYFVQDEHNQVFLVLNHDKPGNGKGGAMKLGIHSTGLEGATFVAQKDDVAGASYYEEGDAQRCNHKPNGDCFAWDHSIGEGSFTWRWSGCCTDGMVLGPMPDSQWEMFLNYTEIRNVEEFRIGSYGDESAFDMAFHAVNAEEDHAFKVEAFTCDNLCFREFEKTFGAPAFQNEAQINPMCGTTVPDIGEAPHDSESMTAKQDFVNKLRAAVIDELQDFKKEEFCTDTCLKAVLHLQEVCTTVDGDWAATLVRDMTELITEASTKCQDDAPADAPVAEPTPEPPTNDGDTAAPTSEDTELSGTSTSAPSVLSFLLALFAAAVVGLRGL